MKKSALLIAIAATWILSSWTQTSSAGDPTSVPYCGNGVVEAGEECDGGFGCSTTCKVVPLNPSPLCGNSFVDPGEECDGGLGCGPDCKLLILDNPPITLEGCGDGIRHEYLGEACDDGNTVDTDGCSNTCKVNLPPPVSKIPPPVITTDPLPSVQEIAPLYFQGDGAMGCSLQASGARESISTLLAAIAMLLPLLRHQRRSRR